ncbi:MAG TPA: hypothetical protein VFL95_04925 [Gemmatimonadales bacterium]|jgi:hypothetical protein|nr:hypothetical protein [Gemmatimonadales bacterium]
MRTRPLIAASLALAALSIACGKSDRSGGAPCGIAALAGPVTLLDQFRVPNQTLSQPPRRLPPRMVTRIAAGPAFASEVGRTDTSLVIGVDGAIPPKIQPGYGVLVVDPAGTARGVVLYEGTPVEGAPHIGLVNLGASSVPLLAIQLETAKIEQPGCPLFPDSILK